LVVGVPGWNATSGVVTVTVTDTPSKREGQTFDPCGVQLVFPYLNARAVLAEMMQLGFEPASQRGIVARHGMGDCG